MAAARRRPRACDRLPGSRGTGLSATGLARAGQVRPPSTVTQASFDGVGMALSLKVPIDHAALPQSDQRAELPARNDGFSFWKLPEQWRPGLASTIGPSEAAAERLLLEQYLPEIDRHPPSAMRAYYCVKGLIPQGLRHRLNSVAIRARTPLRFPRWPCESALVEFWRGWLKQGLEIHGATDAWHIGFWPEGAKC